MEMGRMIEVDFEGEGIRPISLDVIRTGAVIIIGSRKEKKKILIIDDDKFFREALRFKFLDYDCVFAASGEDGIKLVETKQFDLVITDQQMPPGMRGEEVVCFIKKQHPELKVVLMSASVNENLISVAKAAGADYVVSKREVIKTVEELLRR